MGRYRLGDKLGEGGMGAVYCTLDRLTGQTVALKKVTVNSDKLVFTSRTSENNFTLALTREFQTLASLRHPHIISVLDYGFDEQRQPFFTMELLDRPQTILEAYQGCSTEDKVQALIEVLEALAYLHRRGIIHRDLKPGNVLVASDRLKVVDFGLAVARGQETTFAGTLAYLAPEILLEQPATIPSDLYAVGIIAYELFTGKHPFNTATVMELINQTMSETPDLSAVDERFAHIIERLLAKKPEDRYPSAESVIAALRDEHEEDAAIRESFLQAAQFVGRELEISQLAAALTRTLDGNGSVWLVGGESGVGKSRLLEEIRTLALVEGMLVLRGQAVTENSLPYQLWRDPLRRLVLASDIKAQEAADLQQLIPDIGTLLEKRKLPQPGSDRLVPLMIDIFQRQQQPMLLILEDLQWSPESAAVLNELIKTIARMPLLVIASYRDDERPDLPKEVPGAQTLKLHRLDKASIEKLSVSMLGEAGHDADIVNLLLRETEGNAFFIVEVVRALAEEAGQLARVATMTLPTRVFAGGVQQVVARRLARVPQSAHEMLYLAAVAGRELDLDVLRSALVPTAPLDDWIQSCSEAAVLEIHDGKWRFTHDKLREHLLLALDVETKKSLHSRVATALDTVYPDSNQRALDITFHWNAAENPEKEIVFLHRGARYLNRLDRLYEAREPFHRVLLLAEQLYPQADDDLKHRLNWMKAEANGMLGSLYRATGEHERSVEHLTTALEVARQVEHRSIEAHALAILGWVYLHGGESERAENHFHQALEIARPINHYPSIMDALRGLSGLQLAMGDDKAALASVLECLEIARHPEHGTGFHLARALNILGNVYNYASDYQLAVDTYEEARQLSIQSNFLSLLPLLDGNLAFMKLNQGLYQEALDLCHRALTQGQHEQRFWMSEPMLHNAVIYWINDDQATALEWLDKAAVLCLETHDMVSMILICNYQALFAIERGEYEKAGELLERAYTMTQAIQWSNAPVMSHLVDIFLRIRTGVAAQEKLPDIIASVNAIGSPLVQFYGLIGMAALHFQKGEREQALELLGIVWTHPKGSTIPRKMINVVTGWFDVTDTERHQIETQPPRDMAQYFVS